MQKKDIARNSVITIGILGLATVVSLLLRPLAESNTHVALVYVLAVLCVSRFTQGYLYGVVASMVAVVGVNYIFTYPYFEVDFMITGYPLTFMIMLTVAVCVSALTTRIKKQEQIRLEVEKEQLRANLLRAVSHDIRTPLTSIAGAAAGILDNKAVLTEEQENDLLRNIKDEAQWMIRMVENLLSITRMNDEKMAITTQEELAEDVVGSAVVKFSKRFPDIQVSADTPEEVLLVPMDAILIEQVLVNLMENSAIHGGAITQIHLNVSVDHDKAVFSVEDNGQGISTEVLPVMFEGKLASQAGQTYDNKRNMGIGLSVCKSIINAHNGDMRAENKAEGGARVMFILPLGKEENYGD